MMPARTSGGRWSLTSGLWRDYECNITFACKSWKQSDWNRSFSYFTNFSVAVQNIAFTKVVRVWGHTSFGTWTFFPCSYVRSVPGIMKYGTLTLPGIEIDQFALEYQVAGTNLLGQ